MSATPAFEISVWNAWIFMLLELLTFPLFFRVATDRAPKAESHNVAALPKVKKTLLYCSKIIYIPAFIYSIFLPLKPGTLWFYIGLPICLIALFMDVLCTILFITFPVEEPITTGIFAISRNPGYLSFFLMCVGIGIAGASCIFLLFALVWIAAWHFGIPGEERTLIGKYGDAYREYMQRTPRWIGLPKKK